MQHRMSVPRSLSPVLPGSVVLFTMCSFLNLLWLAAVFLIALLCHDVSRLLLLYFMVVFLTVSSNLT